MRKLLCSVNLLPLLALFPFLCLSALSAQSNPQHDRIEAHPDLTVTTSLHNTLPRWSTHDRDLGGLPDSTPLSVQFVLARSPELQTAFDQLLEDQQNPNSPRFHHWLTPEQLGLQYGPTQHDLAALTAWLNGQGLTVSDIAPSRVLVRATGTAATIGSALKTRFHQFQVAGVPQYSATSEPVVPAALAPLISTIAGLSQVTLHPTSHIQALPAPRTPAKAKPNYTDSSGNYHYLFAGDFAKIYDINPLYTANIKGAGQKVAIIGESRVATTDITEYESLSAIPNNVPNTIVVPTASGGSDPGIVMPDEGESDLDLDRVIGVAPSVTADFVISGSSPSLGQGIGIAIDYEINTLRDPVMTLSYGACEIAAGSANTMSFASSMSTAAAEGISVFISSDDSAAAGCDSAFTTAPTTQKLSINYLCASQYVTCVGGTEFIDTVAPSNYWASTNGTGEESALGYIPEGAWNEALTSSPPIIAGSGGGVSAYITKPSFQTGIGVPADGYRDVPDVSFSAASHDGYFGCEADATFSGGGTGDCSKGSGVISSGTSAAAPGWAGVAALLNEKLGSAQGNLNPLIYRLGSLSTSNPFHDVTPTTAGVSPCDLTTPSLCNNSTPSATAATGGLAGYAVTPGYDLVTGWGSIDVFNFVTAASTQASLTATSTTLTANPASIKTTQTAVFTATVSAASGTPTGSIQFSSNGSPLGAPVTLVNGVATSTTEAFTTVGSYTINAVYSGSSAFGDSASQTLTLTVMAAGTTASTSTLTASATALTPSQAVTFTDTVAGSGGTPGGTVQFLIDGTSSALPVTLTSAGVATLGPLTLAAGTHTISAVYSGNNTFAASTSNSVQVVVTAPALLPSSTSITTGATTINPNGFLIVSGVVTGTTGGTVPTGTLTLYDAGAAVSNAIALTNGAVDVAFTGIPAGTYSFYWLYSGDTNYATSQSSPVAITVSASFNATYTLTPQNTTITATDGTSATNTITVASSNGYSTNIALSCAAVFTGSSTDTIVEPTCSLSPATINLLNDTNSKTNTTSLYETSTLTLGSTVPKNIKHATNSHLQLAPMLGGTALAGLFLFLLPVTRRRRTWNALAALLLLTAIAGLGGCGSGGSAKPPISGSPAGNYTITVTGTGAVTTTFTLTLQ